MSQSIVAAAFVEKCKNSANPEHWTCVAQTPGTVIVVPPGHLIVCCGNPAGAPAGAAVAAAAPAEEDKDDGFDGIRWAFVDSHRKHCVTNVATALDGLLKCFPDLKGTEYDQLKDVAAIWQSAFA